MGIGVDRDGKPTSDPSEILSGGGILPFGGYKGTALSFMVEVLASAVSGGQFSHQVDFSNYPKAETSRTGYFLMLIDGGRGQDLPIDERTMEFFHAIRASGVERLPGDRLRAARRRAEAVGIPITETIRDLLAQ